MTPQQTRALEMLLTGATYTAVAAEVGISRHQLWRWTREGEPLAEAIAEEQAERFAHVRRMGRVAVEEAVGLWLRTLRGQNDDGEPDADIRLSDRLESARQVADRFGLPKREEVDHSGKVDGAARLLMPTLDREVLDTLAWDDDAGSDG